MQLQLELKAMEIAGRLEKQREERRKAVFGREWAKYSSGAVFPGRDEKGHDVKTRSPESLGISVSGWKVKINFRPEDWSTIKDMDPALVISISKDGALPRIDSPRKPDIIAGVRMLQNVCDGYTCEINATEGVLNSFNLINLKLGLQDKPDKEGIMLAVAKLAAFEKNVLIFIRV